MLDFSFRLHLISIEGAEYIASSVANGLNLFMFLDIQRPSKEELLSLRAFIMVLIKQMIIQASRFKLMEFCSVYAQSMFCSVYVQFCSVYTRGNKSLGKLGKIVAETRECFPICLPRQIQLRKKNFAPQKANMFSNKFKLQIFMRNQTNNCMMLIICVLIARKM